MSIQMICECGFGDKQESVLKYFLLQSIQYQLPKELYVYVFCLFNKVDCNACLYRIGAWDGNCIGVLADYNVGYNEGKKGSMISEFNPVNQKITDSLIHRLWKKLSNHEFENLSVSEYIKRGIKRGFETGCKSNYDIGMRIGFYGIKNYVFNAHTNNLYNFWTHNLQEKLNSLLEELPMDLDL